MIALIVLGLIISLIGFIGCIIPGIPGPPLSFLALIILSIAKEWEPFSPTLLFIMAGMTILVTMLDYAVPALGARKFGASRFGVWGAILGMIIGLLFFPPWGIFIGAFFGAILGEFMSGKEGQSAIYAGWGVFMGIIFGIVLKLAVSGVMLFFYVKGLF